MGLPMDLSNFSLPFFIGLIVFAGGCLGILIRISK